MQRSVRTTLLYRRCWRLDTTRYCRGSAAEVHALELTSRRLALALRECGRASRVDTGAARQHEHQLGHIGRACPTPGPSARIDRVGAPLGTTLLTLADVSLARARGLPTPLNTSRLRDPGPPDDASWAWLCNFRGTPHARQADRRGSDHMHCTAAPLFGEVVARAREIARAKLRNRRVSSLPTPGSMA